MLILLSGCDILIDEATMADVRSGYAPPEDVLDADGVVCHTSTTNVLLATNLDNGLTAEVADLPDHAQSVSLVPDGDRWVVDDQGSNTLSVLGMEAVEGTATGAAVSADAGTWYVLDMSSRLILEYAGLDAVLAGSSTQVYGTESWQFTRMVVRDGVLYGAWHSTDRVLVFDLVSGTLASEVPLENYDGWVFGMDLTDAGLHLLLEDGLIATLDPDTGALLSAVRLPSDVLGAGGLSCQ